MHPSLPIIPELKLRMSPLRGRSRGPRAFQTFQQISDCKMTSGMPNYCRPMRAFLTSAAILAVATASSMPLSHVESLSNIQRADVNYRLPTDVKPEHYTITITPQKEDGEFVRFTGEVKIRASISTNTAQITLHKADNINIENVEVVDVATQNPLEIKSKKPESVSEFYVITLKAEVVENDLIDISITYTGGFPDGLYGFYKSTYTFTSANGEKQEDVLLVTQFQPTHARKAFPCFDEPGFKATFEITLVVPPGYEAISNSVGKSVASTKSAQQRETDSQEIVFEKTPFMSTYLVAFIVYNKDTYKSTGYASGDLPFRTWASIDEIAAGSGTLSQTEGPKIIAQLEKYTGILYTANSEKIDQAAIPDFSFGAMENWGLVTYRETALLYDSKEHTQTAKKRVSELIAHELTHQWFGNLVTTEWWSSAWLNEGFATYFEYYITNILHPSWRMMERLVIDEQLTAFGADGTLSASPLTNEKVNTPDEAAAHFGTITYSKGGSVVRMFANILGENKFQTALRNYLKDNALTAVTPKELFDALSKAAGNVGLPSNVELTDIFESWTTSTGFPIINVLRKDSKVVFTQERFLPYGSSSKHTYNVPLTLVYNDTKLSEKSIWFLSSQKEVSIEIADIGSENASWILVPTTGYFRVNYDEDNWLLLSEYLQDESLDDIAIEPLERAILIDNALNLARISKLEYSTAIQLLSYLSNEVDYIPWTVAFSGLNYLHRMLADESDIFDNFILHIIKNVYEELGFKVVDKNDDASHIEHVHRANVLNWACRAGHSECINTAVDHLRKYLEKPQSAKVAPDLRSVVYCYGVKHDDTLWTKLWKTLLDTDDATERSLLISSLGCSKVSSTLYLYLESAVLGNVIRTQDIASVFSAVYSNPEGVNAALRFLEYNLPKIEDRASTVMNGLPNIIRGISQYITNEDQKQHLVAIAGRLSNPEHQAVATAGVATAEVNLAWAQRHKESVLSELEKWTPEEPGIVTTTTEGGARGLRPAALSLVLAVVLPALALAL